MPMHYQPAACFKFRLHCHHFNHVLPNPRKVLHGTANRNGPLARGKMAPRPRPELHTLEKRRRVAFERFSSALLWVPAPSCIIHFWVGISSTGLCDAQNSLEYISTLHRTRSWSGNARLPGASVHTALAFSSSQPRVSPTFRTTTFYNL